MSDLSVRDVLVGVLAVRDRLLGEDELADALAACARAPSAKGGECDPGRVLMDLLAVRLGEAGATLALEAERRLAPRHDTGRPDGTVAQSADWRPPPAPTRPTLGQGSRYVRLAAHARGGLGIVFRARDEELGRTVALKEIQEQHADSPGGRERFVFEAEVTGQLEHPGIIPVYGLGRYADGRPYYAMRFVKGQTLEEAIKRFHGRPAGGDAAERSLAFRELLARFVAVCNAVAYAHQQGVLHRDLKPANVMLGEFGEALVVDWGLAKRVGAADQGGEGGPHEAATPSETAAGAVVGTPAYMAPEQALGSGVGRHSDIYALGATLYQLLTGSVPVEAPSVAGVLEKVVRGDVPPARRVDPRVPKALEAVCAKAMATDPARRYESARALADDIERYLAGEPVSAWREPPWRRAARWVSRHRTLAASAAAGLLVGAAALGWIVWDARDRERRRVAEQRRVEERRAAERLEREKEAGRLIDDAAGLESAAMRGEPIPAAALLAQAIIRAERAEGLLAQGADDAELVGRVKRKREALARFERDREMLGRLEAAERGGQSGRGWLDLGKIRKGYREAFAAYFGRADVLKVTKGEAVEKARGSAYRADLIAALDNWWCFSSVKADGEDVEAQRAKGYELATCLDDDPARRALRDALYRKDLAALKEATREGRGKAAAGWVMDRFPMKFPPEEAERLGPTVCRQAMRGAFLDARLAELRAGKAAPASADLRLEVAYFALRPYRRMYLASAKLFEAVFAANPSLKESDRVPAARAAAQAGTGNGEDAGELDEAGRARWRGQALEWLKQELEFSASAIFDRSNMDEDSPAVKQMRQTARSLLKHPDLACVRDKEHLAKLPEGERRAWQSLWADAQSAANPAKKGP